MQTCPECKGNQRVPEKDTWVSEKTIGIWTKTCPTCQGKGKVEEYPVCSVCRERHPSDDRHPCE